MNEPKYFLLVGRQGAGELMSECTDRGALTTLPLDVAWRNNVVVCECGVTFGLSRRVFEELQREGDAVQRKLSAYLDGSANEGLSRS